MTTTADIVILGGGVTGASLAFQLARAGAGRIVLVEKGHIASGPTGRSSGIVRQHYTIPALAAMARDSTRVFQRFHEITGGDAGFVQTGAIFTADAANAGALRQTVAAQQALGIDASLVDPAALARLEPRANLESIALASFEPDAGYADPALTANSYAAAAEQLGVLILRRTEALAFEIDAQGIAGIQTSAGHLATRSVVLAAGPWSGRLAALAGVELPLSSTRHPVVVLQRPASWREPMHVWLDIVHGWYYKPERGSTLIAGGMHIGDEQSADPDNHATTPSFDETEAHAEAAIARFPILAEGQAQGGWAGIYDVSPDGQPVLDRVDDLPGLVVAAGFSGHGFKLAPAVGVLLRELILDGAVSSYDAAPFRFDRFRRGALTRGAYAYSIVG